MMTNSNFAQILEELHSNSIDITTSAIIATDGIPIAYLLGQNINPDRIGGMCSALLALGKRSTQELSCGNFKQTVVEGDDGFTVMVQASRDIILAVSARKEAKLGLVLLDTRDAVKKIQQVI